MIPMIVGGALLPIGMFWYDNETASSSIGLALLTIPQVRVDVESKHFVGSPSNFGCLYRSRRAAHFLARIELLD